MKAKNTSTTQEILTVINKRTQSRYEQIKQILRGPLLMRHFDMVKGAIILKEEQAQTLAMAIVIDFEKQGRKK